MNKKYFIALLIIFLTLYLLEPIPYCKISDTSTITGDAVYTLEQVLETKEFNITLLNVKGKSMYPTIQEPSQCLCVKKEKYSVGDIIFFFAEIGGEINGISHRIVKIEDESIYTKGDNNLWVDPPMTEENIVCSVPTIPRYNLLFN